MQAKAVDQALTDQKAAGVDQVPLELRNAVVRQFGVECGVELRSPERLHRRRGGCRRRLWWRALWRRHPLHQECRPASRLLTGATVGFDLGANADRTMMLVYNLPAIETLFQRYGGVNGSAYVVAGLGMTALSRGDIYVVPIVSGMGARLGLNFGYLKFTDHPTWNPF